MKNPNPTQMSRHSFLLLVTTLATIATTGCGPDSTQQEGSGPGQQSSERNQGDHCALLPGTEEGLGTLKCFATEQELNSFEAGTKIDGELGSTGQALSSYKIATFFQHMNYGGAYFRTYSKSACRTPIRYADLRPYWNDTISSVRIFQPRCRVTFYEHIYYGGRSGVLGSSSSYIGWFNDMASSIGIDPS